MIGTGIHDLHQDAYFADPCEQPSLTRSGIVTLEKATPAKFAAMHPRLTQWPEFAKPSTRSQEIGQIVHRILLGAGSEFVVKDCSEFMNKNGTPAKTWGNAEASAWKEAEEAAGRIVIGRDLHREALNVAESLERVIGDRFGTDWYAAARFEQTLIWQRETAHGAIWCRARPDVLLPFGIIDAKVKVSAMRSLSDDDLARVIEANGGDIQAVWYPQGLQIATGSLLPFLFAFAEFEPSYDARLIEMDAEWAARVEYRIERACDTFAKCLYANEWPGWPKRSTVSAPPWKLSAWLDAELADVDASLEVSE